VLTRNAVARLPAGSPERALAAWWRALQTLDERGAQRLLPEGSGKRLKPVLPLLYLTALALRLRVVEVHRTGRRAVVYTEMAGLRPIGARRYVESLSILQGFSMVRNRGGWRLGDDYFFDRIGSALVRATPTGK